MKSAIDTLIEKKCSLVIEKDGKLYTFYKKGVRDLEYLLNKQPGLLRRSFVADKVIGKAAAGMIAVGDVKALYAQVLSRKAVPILEKARIEYSYSLLVDNIVHKDGEKRCPLEEIVENAQTAEEITELLFRHFEEMKKKK